MTQTSLSRRTWLFALFTLVFLTISSFIPVLACRIEITRPFYKPAYQGIQTREHSVDVAIKDQVAKITVSAVFYNPNNTDLEGDYWFPLYEDAAVSSFTMVVDGKEMTGEILDADQARKTYEEIVRRMKDPGLLEYAGTRMIRQRIYPIKAHGEVRVILKYTQVLKADNGVVSFKYPLSSAKPDNSFIGRVHAGIFIESGKGVKNVYSTSHALTAGKRTDKSAMVSFDASNYMPDKALTLYYTLSDSDIGASVITNKPADEDGYFILLVSPKIDTAKEKITPKDFVFVIDSSGSMAGEKIRGAKQALVSCLGSLNGEDRFNIINFSDSTEPFKDSLVAADKKNLEEAGNFAETIAPSGGTAIDDALKTALLQFGKGEEGRLPVIVFLTDGMPTVGEQDKGRILADVKNGNLSGARIFVFGVGNDVNTALLDALAEDNGGVREYVTGEKDSIERGIGSLASKISSPILTDVKAEFKGVKVYDLFPRKLEDIFRGSQIMVCGRYEGSGTKTLLISGKSGKSTRNFEYNVDFGGSPKDGHIAQLWAVKKTAFLLDEINMHGANMELINEIKRLGKKFGIVTPYTSFLITDQKLKKMTLGGRSEAEAVNMFQSEQTGESAVNKSAGLARAKAAPAPASRSAFAPAMPAMKDEAEAQEYENKLNAAIINADGKTFVEQQDGYFTDTEYDASRDGEPKEIKFMSDEYTNLIKEKPGIAVFLKVAVKVVVKYEGLVYKITE